MDRVSHIEMWRGGRPPRRWMRMDGASQIEMWREEGQQDDG